MRRAGFALLAAAAALPALAQAPANPATEIEGDAIEVVGTRPVPGLATPLEDIPSSVQSTNARALAERDAREPTEELERTFAGVTVNDPQGNGFQRTLNYRGFSASPLLGMPQGLSVFVDGVRVNEPFGDVVNWDLIPKNAIATMHMLSGPNPQFGLNTLGGALTVNTKSGFAFPGASGRLSAGSFGRRAVEAEIGGHGERADYFAAVHAHEEEGWREHSPNSIRQGFFKAGWQDARTDLDVSLALADNTVQGTQTLPLSMLGNPRQAYTYPDRTENRLSFLTARASRFLDEDVLLSGTAYLRGLRQGTVSSNVNDNFDPALPSGAGNAEGANARTALDQRAAGAALQLVIRSESGAFRNELTLGGAFDAASADFTQDEQEASFTADRGTAGFGGFAPGVRAGTHNSNRALYVIEQLSPSARWTFTASARYDFAQVRIRDRLGNRPALDGDHDFRRLNPGVGANWKPSGSLTVFAAASEGMRVPSPVELTCADPNTPCSLPNQFLADPPLKPVVARTVEAGARLRPSSDVRFSAAFYRSVLSDDIQFVTSGTTTSAGFFQNAGRTLRQGMDFGLSLEGKVVSLKAVYSYLRAEYLTPFSVRSPNNSSRDAADEILVQPGNKLPGIPQNTLKLLAEWTPAAPASVGLAWTLFGRQYARGNENNQDEHGTVPGYGVVQAFARYRLDRQWELSLRIDNVFDRRYQTFGVLGENFFNGPGNSFNPAGAAPEQFVSPGSPRALWIALRYAAAQ